MNKSALFTALVVLIVLLFLSNASAQRSRKSVSEAEVTGTFKMNFTGKYKKLSNDLDILALGNNKLRIAFELIYPYTVGREISVNMGSSNGEATIKGDTAVFKSNEFGPCTITIKFVRPGTVKVTQTGSDSDCGFGHNVFAGGTYKKVSSKRPKFIDVN
jgi:hypothetical protein